MPTELVEEIEAEDNTALSSELFPACGLFLHSAIAPLPRIGQKLTASGAATRA